MSTGEPWKDIDSIAIRWLQRAWIIGIPAYLLAFAWRFANERLYADSGYYLARVINEGAFHIEHGRWVLALPELLPLLAVKLGAALPVVILLHSLGNVLFLGAAVLFAWRVLDDQRSAMLLVGLHIIGLAHGLFCPVFELYYGVALLVLFLAVLGSDRFTGAVGMALLLLFFIGAISSHPMTLLLAAGSLVITRVHWQRSTVLPLLIALIGVVLFRALTMSAYEVAQLSFVQRLAFPWLVLPLFSPSFLLGQIERVLAHYPDVLATAFFTISLLFHYRSWRTLFIFVLGLLALHVLTGLYLPDPTHDRYREQVDFGFAAWTLIVAFTAVWPMHERRIALLLLLIVCGAYRIAHIERIAPLYAARTEWQLGLIEEARTKGMQKAIIDPQGITFGTPDDRVAPYWSTGIECLLLSAKDGPSSTISIITTDDLECPGVRDHLDKFVFRCWDVLEPEDLDARYFRLAPGSYAPLPER